MEKSTQKKILITGFLIILFYWGLENLGQVMGVFQTLVGMFMPFIFGGAMAFVLNVPMKVIEKHLFVKTKNKALQKMRRPIAYLLTLIFVFAVIIFSMVIIIPELTSTITTLVVQIPEAVNQLITSIEKIFSDYPQVVNYLSNIQIDWQSTISYITQVFTSGTKEMINSGFSVISNVISVVTTFFIGFVFSIYILMQKEKLGRQTRKAIYALLKEELADRVLEVAHLTNKTFSGFLTGQCVEAVILGSMFGITMTILRLPYALLIAVTIACTALIPMVGAFIGCGIGVLLIILVSPVQALVFVIMFFVLQQLEGNLIYPHVVGNSVGLSGIWVLMAVTIGGSLFGIIGMLVFIPLVSVCYALFRDFTNRRLQKKKIAKEKIQE